MGKNSPRLGVLNGVGEVSHPPLTVNDTPSASALISPSAWCPRELAQNNALAEDEGSVDSLFVFDTLAYGPPINEDRCINYGWSVARPVTLYGASEPIGNAFTVAQTNTETAIFFTELVEKNISVVMDLRHPSEIHRDNLNLSYPEKLGEHRLFENTRVTCLGAQRLGEHLACSTIAIQAHSNNQNAPNTSVHSYGAQCHRYHYLGWSDMGTIPPNDLIGLGNILLDLSHRGANVLVHCMGGAGRTGTLITYLQTKARLLQSGNAPLSPLDNVHRIRQQILRNRDVRGGNFVEVPEQLDLILQALRQERLL